MGAPFSCDDNRVHLYCVCNIRWILVPYISSKRLNIVSDKEAGGSSSVFAVPFLRSLGGNFLAVASPSLTSLDSTVGGSCIGSPAKINFFALKMGTQHTYQAVSTRQRGDNAGKHTASIACVASSIIKTSNRWLRNWRPPAV